MEDFQACTQNLSPSPCVALLFGFWQITYIIRLVLAGCITYITQFCCREIFPNSHSLKLPPKRNKENMEVGVGDLLYVEVQLTTI